MIPKIIHKIAPENESDWYTIWKKSYPSWKKHFSVDEYQHFLWNDEKDLENFIKNNYIQYYNYFCALPLKIMKIDIARLCILHYYGGIYSDMDMFCYKNFYENLLNRIYFVEHVFGVTINDETEFLQNSLIASEKNHEFFISCIENSIQRYNWCLSNNIFDNDLNDRGVLTSIVLHVTGPFLIQDTFINYQLSKKDNLLSYEKYNNHPMYYDDSLYTKHVGTCSWIDKNSDDDFTKNFDFYRNYVT